MVNERDEIPVLMELTMWLGVKKCECVYVCVCVCVCVLNLS